MRKWIYVNIELPEDTIQELKEKTGSDSTKDALYTAITHYLECFFANEGSKEGLKEKRKGGRTPVYLTPIINCCELLNY